MGRVMVYPSVKCTARSKRTKKQCGLWAIPGLTVCRFHGGGAHRDVAERRLTLATLLQNDRRPPWEVLLDAVHVADSLMRDARVKVDGAEDLTPRQLDNLVDSTKLAHHMARTAIDTGAAAKIADVIKRNVDLEGDVIARTLAVVLDALLEALCLPKDRAREVRAWAARAAAAALDGYGGDDAEVTVPPPPLDGYALVRTDRPQLEPAPAAASSSAATDRAAAGRQPDWRADPAAARPAPASGTPAPTADDRPLDAELVDDPDVDDPETRAWDKAGEEGHPLSGRVLRATERRWLSAE